MFKASLKSDLLPSLFNEWFSFSKVDHANIMPTLSRSHSTINNVNNNNNFSHQSNQGQSETKQQNSSQKLVKRFHFLCFHENFIKFVAFEGVLNEWAWGD